MGFLDKLKKISQNLQDNISEEIKKSFSDINQQNSNYQNISIPTQYSEFPVFNGNMTSLTEKNEPRYIRCTMDYKNVSSIDFTNYINTINAAGYVQASNVRYEKANTYIIVEHAGNSLHLVFHIKR